ncbi:NB-ARC domain-containing protein [Cronbergia sp. UHCC 0137]|uniref:NB-ARC domain-containing protein n=1 Tax=Cronbergia sp. UHCC 0137 TaxID=3110239 RepID=UPI002B214BD8|nr:NB-ARC domain-containing protein [Cronbergia sp. UHCC 0137]MEA5621110.1 NB-ARC domain-containing protein [Cronbergia sp. UHCC 0137]
MLQFVDEVVQKQTGDHLDDLEKAVLKGIWQGQTYNQIADECGYNSPNYIGDISRKLFKIISEQLGEDINKSNFCWTLERVVNSPQFVSLTNTEINWCHVYPNHHINQVNEEIINNQSPSHDLALSPKITQFYGRETELQTLSDWLINQNTHLISILGLPGIGKTTLVKKFIDLNLQQFDVFIWKNIKLSDSLDMILKEILTFTNFEHTENNKLTQLLRSLTQKRYLIILDDIQEIFISGQVAGQYKPEYKDYKTFFTKMIEIEHQSSLILISQEQCQEMLCLDEKLYSVKCLELEGLNNTEILRNLGLKNEETWSKLIDLYAGNPAYLKDIANLIKNIFQNEVADFLSEEFLLTENIKYQLSELFNRLSTIEKQIVLKISESNQLLTREDLKEKLSYLSSMELINGLHSLKKRYLVTSVEGDKKLFNLSPVFREYVKIKS